MSNKYKAQRLEGRVAVVTAASLGYFIGFYISINLSNLELAMQLRNVWDMKAQKS